jgi:hypothetical protein
MIRLEEKLRRTREKATERMPEHALEVLGRHSRELEEANRAADAVGTGDRAPDFRRPSTSGEEVQLSDLLARGPVILSFYRGRW